MNATIVAIFAIGGFLGSVQAAKTQPVSLEQNAQYNALFNYANSSLYLNLNAKAAHEFARKEVQKTDIDIAKQWKPQFLQAYKFAKFYLNLKEKKARQIAHSWAVDTDCTDENLIPQLRSEYTQRYNYAFSSNGLNYQRTDAQAYALRQISSISHCVKHLQ